MFLLRQRNLSGLKKIRWAVISHLEYIYFVNRPLWAYYFITCSVVIRNMFTSTGYFAVYIFFSILKLINKLDHCTMLMLTWQRWMAVTILCCRCRVAGGRVNATFFFQSDSLMVSLLALWMKLYADNAVPWRRALTLCSRLLVAFSFIQ